ncbi:MAG: GNAT family N-acetyltransferase [Planctomycetota bacterium]
MSSVPMIGPPLDDDELKRFGELMHIGFAFPPERIAGYYAAAEPENFRFIRTGRQLVGGLAALPMGQFFGGRPLRMAGIAVVTTAPDQRGGDAATRLLRATLEELHTAGVPLSVLYPATLPVYRRAGYELAGANLALELQTARLDVRDRALEMRPATPADEPAIHAVYRAAAERTPGFVDRGRFNWERVHDYRGTPARGYVVCAAGSVAGYVFLLDIPSQNDWYDVRVTDVVAADAAAARRLLTFFADHRMQREKILLRGSPTDPLLMQLAEQAWKVQNAATWMLRIVDVRGALEGRGYPPGVSTEVHFDLRDDVLPPNQGRWVLRVADGRGVVEPGGRGSFALDARGLAAMYTGYQSPHDVLLAGRGTAPDADLAAAAAVFAGPQPWMRDAF